MSETDFLLPPDCATGLTGDDNVKSYDPQLSQRLRSSLKRYRAEERAKRRWGSRATKFCKDMCCPEPDQNQIQPRSNRNQISERKFKRSNNRSYPSAQSLFHKTTPPSWEFVNIGSETFVLLEPLQKYALLEFNPAQDSHISMLRRLWGSKYPEGMFGLKSQRWLNFGFQTPTPVTDFRGAGMLGLRNIVYVAERYPETMDRFDDFGLLYAACCLNVTQALVYHLRIHTASGYDTKQHLLDPSAFNNMNSSKPEMEPDQKEWVESMKGFAGLVLNHQASTSSSMASLEIFDDLVGANMCLLTHTWEELVRKNKTRNIDPPTIMDFPQALFSSRCNLMFLLSHKPSTIMELMRWIDDLEEYDLIS